MEFVQKKFLPLVEMGECPFPVKVAENLNDKIQPLKSKVNSEGKRDGGQNFHQGRYKAGFSRPFYTHERFLCEKGLVVIC